MRRSSTGECDGIEYSGLPIKPIHVRYHQTHQGISDVPPPAGADHETPRTSVHASWTRAHASGVDKTFTASPADHPPPPTVAAAGRSHRPSPRPVRLYRRATARRHHAATVPPALRRLSPQLGLRPLSVPRTWVRATLVLRSDHLGYPQVCDRQLEVALVEYLCVCFLAARGFDPVQLVLV